MTLHAPKYKIQDLDPRALEIPEVRVTTEWDPDELEAFKRDMGEEGIETALLVAKTEDHLYVIDGRHRLEEALLKGYTTVPCRVREMDEMKMYLRNLASNRLRGKAPVSQEIRVVKHLQEKLAATVEQIQKGTGFSRERVETLMLISKAHPLILDCLDRETIKLCHAEQLIRLPAYEQQEQMAILCEQRHPSCSEFKTWVNMTLEEIERQKNKKPDPGPAAAPAPNTASCGCCHDRYEVQQLIGLPLCPGCNAVLIQAYLDKKKRDAAAAGTKQPEPVIMVPGSPGTGCQS